MTAYFPQTGTRDLLPLEVAQKLWIAEGLQQVYHQWGYQRIITSTLEGMDTLMAGGAIDRATVLAVSDGNGASLGLRPELTASIARTAVTRMAGDTNPQRLYYSANVFRRPGLNQQGQQLELYQSGVELLHAAGERADAEILLLLAAGLHRLGLTDWQVILGEVSLTRSLLAPFPPALRESVRRCLARLDRVALAALPLSPDLRDRALWLFDLRGQPAAVLQRVAALDLEPAAQGAVARLKTLLDWVQTSAIAPLPLTLDLSLLEPIDYYTGLVFEVVARPQQQFYLLGKGGRYDQLLALYDPTGQGGPGIGFALNLEAVHACLLSSEQLPSVPPASDWLVIPQTAAATAAALAYAAKLRDSEHLVRVELELGERSPAESRAYARTSRIRYLAWVAADGTPEVEKLVP